MPGTGGRPTSAESSLESEEHGEGVRNDLLQIDFLGAVMAVVVELIFSVISDQ